MKSRLRYPNKFDPRNYLWKDFCWACVRGLIAYGILWLLIKVTLG